MTMTPKERKIELLKADVTVSGIARELGLSVTHVSQVISGKRRSPNVEAAVAEKIGKSAVRVFGDAA